MRTRMFQTLALALMLLSCFGCGAATKQISIVEEDPSVQLAREIGQGKIYYLRACGACHRHYRPAERSPSDWQAILAKKAPKISLNNKQFNQLRRYILHNSEKAFDVK